VRILDGHSHRRYTRRRRFRHSLAVDADGRGTPPGRGSRRVGGATTRSGSRAAACHTAGRDARHARGSRSGSAGRRTGKEACREGRGRDTVTRCRSDTSEKDRRVAGVSRTFARRHRSRPAARNRLGVEATCRIVAQADRTGLVLVRGERRPRVHAGATG
jgi:hypothetical protein